MDNISTQRALEVVLSRVRMHPAAADALLYSLGVERRNPHALPPDMTTDDFRATLQLVLGCFDGIDASFPKTALIGRIRSAQDMIRARLTQGVTE